MSPPRCPCAQTSISLPFITATADGPKHIETNLSRAKFEELASDLLDRCRIPVEQALKDANLSVKDINEVILVGGSTRIPAVQVRGAEHIRGRPHQLRLAPCLRPQLAVLAAAAAEPPWLNALYSYCCYGMGVPQECAQLQA